jgi:ribosomal protein S18 acetylase RimI-like enzyme
MRAYSIRKARPDDLANITRITREAYAIYVERLGREPKPMLRDYMSAIEAGDVSLLDVEDALAGVLVLEREPDHILIYSIALAPTFQGQGFGKTLMDFAETLTREAGLSEVRLYTNEKMTRNIAFYTSLGYVETARRPAEHHPESIVVFMSKAIQS